jgi:hypothetical protein
MQPAWWLAGLGFSAVFSACWWPAAHFAETESDDPASESAQPDSGSQYGDIPDLGQGSCWVSHRARTYVLHCSRGADGGVPPCCCFDPDYRFCESAIPGAPPPRCKGNALQEWPGRLRHHPQLDGR